jgi:dTDP-4-amino-4,6-dideoxy-D-galactose acyltransferase
MNFERVISQVPTSGMHELVKVAAIPDIQELTEISQSVLIKDSRFNNNFFDIELVKRFYKIWTEKAVNGQFDDGCLAYQHDGQKVGFITYKIISDTANIGLLAVHPNFHSQGIGQTLIRSLISFLDKTKIHKVTVSTEGRNLGAQRFYTRNSFTPSSIQAWLYSDDRDMPLEINPG